MVRAGQDGRALTVGQLEYIIEAYRKTVAAKHLRRIGHRFLPASLIFEREFDVGSNQQLNVRADATSGRLHGYPVDHVGRRIDEVVAHDRNQPGIEPVFCLGKTTGEGNGSGAYKAGAPAIRNLICVMSIHLQSPELKLAVFEPDVAACSVEWVVDRGKCRKEYAVHVESVAPVVVERAETQRCVIPWPRWPGRLHLFTDRRVAFQIEFLREANINVL